MQGVIGVYSKKDAAQKSLHILYGVQHRGQESAGVTAASNYSLRTWKGKGLVSAVFDEHYANFVHPTDYIFIGSASGENTNNGYPPVECTEHPRYKFSLALDGYFPNKSESNEDVFKETLLHHLWNNDEIQDAFIKTMKAHRKSYYSIVMAVWDKKNNTSFLISARDERGIRPLFHAANKDNHYITSESSPIDVIENMGEPVETREDVPPGAMIIIGDHGMKTIQVLEPRKAHCVFEWVYFGRPDSVIEGQTVHKVRKQLGHALVQAHNLKVEYLDDEQSNNNLVLIPVPDSGRSVTTGVAEKLGVIADEGVIKNAYMGRTYIIDDPEFRKTASDLKHNIIKETVLGKKVIICDDSIVRGTVSESIAQNLLKAGATEVQFLVSYAPILYPCFSDPKDKPLAAKSFMQFKLKEIGNLVANNLPSINKVLYNSEKDILNAVGLPSETICTFCISGNNPFEE